MKYYHSRIAALLFAFTGGLLLGSFVENSHWIALPVLFFALFYAYEGWRDSKWDK